MKHQILKHNEKNQTTKIPIQIPNKKRQKTKTPDKNKNTKRQKTQRHKKGTKRRRDKTETTDNGQPTARPRTKKTNDTRPTDKRQARHRIRAHGKPAKRYTANRQRTKGQNKTKNLKVLPLQRATNASLQQLRGGDLGSFGTG